MKANYMIIGTQWHRLPLWSQKVSCVHCSALQWYCVILGTHWQWLSLWSLKVICLYKSALQWLFVIYSSPSLFSFECRLSVWFEDFRSVKTDVMIMWIWQLVVWWVGSSVAEEHTAVTCPEVRSWIFQSLVIIYETACYVPGDHSMNLWILSSSDILT